MKKTLFGGLALVLMSSIMVAAEGRSVRSSVPASVSVALLGQASEIPMPVPLSPVPDPLYYQPGEMPQYQPPAPSYSAAPYTITPSVAQPVELFQNVRYRGSRNIAPCAVPTVIQVADPCSRGDCCKSCVNVQVCVPPCDPATVKVTRDGHKVRYDFGKYAVVAKTVGNHVVVHYQD